MDPKQTSPLGAPQVGGQEGQPVQPTPVVGDVSGANSQAEAPASPAPVFSTGTTQPAKMAGDLGAESLSTGANVSRTMDSLNDTNQSATGAPIFAKHKFDKIEYATGDILLNKDDPKPKRRFFGGSSAPRPKSAAEISREARREAKRLRKLNKSAGAGSVIESTPATTPAPAEKPANPNSSKTTKILVGAVIGILVIVAGVLGVIALTSGNKKPSNKPSNDVSTVASEEEIKTAFSDYLSYLFYGDNVPSGDLLKNFEKTWNVYQEGGWLYNENIEDTKNPFYAEQILNESSFNNSKREEYFIELNNRWSMFADIYSGELADDFRMPDPQLYFFDLARLGNLDNIDIVNIYKSDGTDTSKDVVLLAYSTDSTDYDIETYSESKTTEGLSWLNIVIEASNSDCIADDNTMTKCDITALTKYEENFISMEGARAVARNTRARLRENAVLFINELYTEVFKINENNGQPVPSEESL